MDAIVETIGLALLHVADDQPRQIAVEILLELRNLRRLRRLGADGGDRPVVAALDGAAGRLGGGVLDAGGRIARRRQLGLEGLDLGLGRGQLALGLVRLGLELRGFGIPLLQLFLQAPTLLA